MSIGTSMNSDSRRLQLQVKKGQGEEGVENKSEIESFLVEILHEEVTPKQIG